MSSAAPEDDDRTVIRKPPAPPPRHSGNALPVGTRLEEFELTGVIGEGGFGIVYTAHDHSLDRTVAVKEYMPASLAQRDPAPGRTQQVQVSAPQHAEVFEAGRRSFIKEARLLAAFDHPALVNVNRYWEANGTAYMAMPLYQGRTLRDAVRAAGRPPDEATLLALLGPLTEALNVIHAERCYHRDIAPDNILLLAENGRPLLLDFGAARRVIGEGTQALTVILKPGYAPIEQYAELPDLKQGPWTDVYALAATVHWTITGRTPPAALGRMVTDAYVPLAQAAAGRYSPGFLQAIDRALAAHPSRRTPDIATLRAELGLVPAPAAVDLDLDLDVDIDLDLAPPPAPMPAPPPVARPAPVLPPRTAAATQPAPTPASPPRGKGLLMAGGVLAALAAAAAAWLMR